ncbi:565_t:CDS:2, partial [Funneliformis geosporum]
NFSTPTNMEVENTSTSIPTDKGKAPEINIPSVNKEPLDYDQSFDVAENMLDKNNGNNALHFGRETEAPIFFAFCAADIFLPNKPNKEKCNNVYDLFNRPQFPTFTGATLAYIHNNLAFTLTRVSTIEAVLNISSISPEQAKIINSNPFKDQIDKMDKNIDWNDVVIAGINTLKSTIRRQKAQVTKLQLKNSILKQNLSANFNKLNNALAAVAQM